MAFAAVDCGADEVPALQLAPLPSPRFNGELAFQAAHSTPSDEVRRPPSWPREHIFEKALTPSDVGLLNRLVVPKQHAEKHFYRLKRTPMMAAAMAVLLEFKDGEGKAWRFRYSYCANSRIYVITKGWRRFVREKGLQAGDTVAFSRSAIGSSSFRDELHIDYWKKKTHKKQQEDTTTTADVVSVDSRVVMLFGVDIARGEHGQQCRHRQGPELAIA